MSLYADDPQVHADYAVYDTGPRGETPPEVIDFAATILVSNDGTAGCEWIGETVASTHPQSGEPAAKRTLRVELAGLDAGTHRLRLGNPDGNDIELGSITLY